MMKYIKEYKDSQIENLNDVEDIHREREEITLQVITSVEAALGKILELYKNYGVEFTHGDQTKSLNKLALNSLQIIIETYPIKSEYETIIRKDCRRFLNLLFHDVKQW